MAKKPYSHDDAAGPADPVGRGRDRGWPGRRQNLTYEPMSGTKKDIDPVSELVDEDDEQSLPDVEHETTTIDLGAAGPLAAGRAAIARHAKRAPKGPGVYRMIDRNGDVLYVGKAKSIRKRILSYARPTATTTRASSAWWRRPPRSSLDRDRDRGAAAQSQSDQGLRPRFSVLLRDDKSFPYILITGDHWAHGSSSTAAHPEGNYAPSPRSGGRRTIGAAAHSCCVRARTAFESRTRPCLLHQIKAARRPARARSSRLRRLVREANAFCQAKSNREGGAGAEMEGVRRARLRTPRSTATALPRSRPCRPTRASIRAASRTRTSCRTPGRRIPASGVLFTTGQNWGTAPISRPTARSAPASCSVPFWRSSTTTAVSAAVMISRDRWQALLGEALHQERPQGRDPPAPTR